MSLGSVTGGRIDQVNVQEGDKVEADEVVAVVNGATRGLKRPRDGALATGWTGALPPCRAGRDRQRRRALGHGDRPGAPPVDGLRPGGSRHGRIQIGQVLPVTVDSFPGETFEGTVTHIADKAEFTPRNVQTTDNRKTTVFAVRADLQPSGRAS